MADSRQMANIKNVYYFVYKMIETLKMFKINAKNA